MSELTDQDIKKIMNYKPSKKSIEDLDKLLKLQFETFKEYASQLAKETANTNPWLMESYKPKWSFVDFESLLPMVQVLEWGNANHKDNSDKGWRDGTGYRYSQKGILESMMRHLTAMLDGEENDPESGLSHMAHLQANTMFYNYFKRKQDKENEKTNYPADAVCWLPVVRAIGETQESKEAHQCCGGTGCGCKG